TKNLGAFGDAGMCVTNDPELAARLAMIRVHGMEPKYYHQLVGGNFRIDELQAAVLVIKLRHLDAWTRARQENACFYFGAFERAGLKEIVTLPAALPGRHIYNQFVIRAPNRDALKAHLGQSGVGTEIYYPVPLHRQQCFADLGYRAIAVRGRLHRPLLRKGLSMAMAGPLTPAWGVLETLAATRKNFDLGAAFATDAARETRYTYAAAGLTLDVSRQCIDEAVHRALLQLPDAVGLREAIEAMWRGDPINSTERRAAWHVLLRRPGVATDTIEHSTNAVSADSPKEFAEVLAERERMLAFAEEIRASGQFETVINIGIGGSDLGPAMAVQALRSWRNPESSAPVPVVHFVSNVDGCALHDLLQTANPQRTLFIVCSKTFTTQETLANAHVAREWILARLGVTAIPDHFAAVSVNAAAMDNFGIHPARRFAMWDWVGGRYSVWSAVGLALAIAIGRAAFDDFLAGAHAIDEHFRRAPWAENLPVLLALVGIWNVNFLEIPTLAVLPYSDRLARFPAFLQQLEMESNGKSVM
ncbi:MAG: hypothetical protein EBT81_11865, partial [Gammaproteobacteria bacterium]|nr:hypothetical protein [Gammaproteobacteria bacterium]